MIHPVYFAMFIGHFGPAEFLLHINKTIPVLPIAIGVSYPDLLWPVLVYLKKEKVRVSASSPLQNTIEFVSYPFSHSLVLSTILTLIPATVCALIYHRPIVGLFFLIAALSHWLLDTLMHLPDLPILGFGRDKKIGLALWNHLPFAFVFEYVFFAACTLLFTPSTKWVLLLIGGLAFHALNANSFFGLTKKNPTSTANLYATLALVGFGAAIVWFTLTI